MYLKNKFKIIIFIFIVISFLILHKINNKNITIKSVHETKKAYSMLLTDGSVISWGNKDYGGDSSSVAKELLSGVKSIKSNFDQFAALKYDGSVITWGGRREWDKVPLNIIPIFFQGSKCFT